MSDEPRKIFDLMDTETEPTDEQLAALAGLAPYNRDSGQHHGPRFTGHGRPRLRRALYMATLSAIRSPGDIADFYRRLRLSGKPAKVAKAALIATARKLLCFLNSSLKLASS
jgi:transposase